MFNKITAVVLVVSDLAKSINFYQKKLGLKLNKRDRGYAEFNTVGTVLELMEEKTTGELAQKGLMRASQKVHNHYLAWQAVKDITLVYNQLLEKGVKFIVKPKQMPWGEKVAYFTDPDGNIWEISQRDSNKK